MSEKFGLDWKQYDSRRMAYMLEVMAAYVERERRESRKLQQKNYGRER